MAIGRSSSLNWIRKGLASLGRHAEVVDCSDGDDIVDELKLAAPKEIRLTTLCFTAVIRSCMTQLSSRCG